MVEFASNAATVEFGMSQLYPVPARLAVWRRIQGADFSNPARVGNSGFKIRVAVSALPTQYGTAIIALRMLF